MTYSPSSTLVPGALVLVDGSIFEGTMAGATPDDGYVSGEVVFNTAMAGYQEVLTDPSYAGQIVTFTYPHIGNYGTTPADAQSGGTFTRGLIVRDLPRRHSNWRAERSLEGFLQAHNLAAIAGLDTRRLTRLLRDSGAMVGAFGPTDGPGAVDLETLKQKAADEPGTDGVDLVAQVTTDKPYTVAGPAGNNRKIVAFDFGIKTSIVNQLSQLATVDIVPASTTAEQVLNRQPDGVFLSNGPGDPRQVPYAIEAVKTLVGKVPLFGICLGHQILSLAIGGTIIKLPFGHHGANHPVSDKTTNVVEITSQNHNFAVDPASIRDVADITHVNLNDGVCQGIALKTAPAFSVQHHPEASPGPHDSYYLFDRFAELMDNNA